MSWINFKDQEPEERKDLYYYFKHIGVWKGQYYGDHLFVCNEGPYWTGGDVTHWQYDEGQERPEKPEMKKT